ncbi:MAG: hypothetical protein H0T64_08500 [Pyrinomonadaceae bacterium]|jgi:hypothetical protein|nr:hypothetical protein [Pyrinomonadaceae bacterium]
MTEMPAVVPHACLQCNLSDADQFSFRHSGAKQIKLADKISNIFHQFVTTAQTTNDAIDP